MPDLSITSAYELSSIRVTQLLIVGVHIASSATQLVPKGRIQMAFVTTEQQKKNAKPDLDKLYGPVGIQAVTAANCYCGKKKEDLQPKVQEEFPLPTD